MFLWEGKFQNLQVASPHVFVPLSALLRQAGNTVNESTPHKEVTIFIGQRHNRVIETIDKNAPVTYHSEMPGCYTVIQTVTLPLFFNRGWDCFGRVTFSGSE